MKYDWQTMGLCTAWWSRLPADERARLSGPAYVEPAEDMDELAKIDAAIAARRPKKGKKICEMSVGTIFKDGCANEKGYIENAIKSICDKGIAVLSSGLTFDVKFEYQTLYEIISEPTPEVGDLVERLMDKEWDAHFKLGNDIGKRSILKEIGPCPGSWSKPEFENIPFSITAEGAITYICPIRSLRIIKKKGT